MKNDLDTIFVIVGMIGAWIRGVADNLTKKETVVNIIFSAFFCFGALGLLSFLPTYVKNFHVLTLIVFCLGFITKDFTIKMRYIVFDIYDIFIDWLKRIFKKN